MLSSARQFVKDAVLGSLKLRSIAEKMPDAMLKWVLLPVFSRHKLVLLFNMFSIVLPLPNVRSEPHITLWALKSPARMNGLGNCEVRSAISDSRK